MSEEQQAPVVDLFAGMKKKKKKKTAESPAASTRDVEQTITGETEDFAGLKKKKASTALINTIYRRRRLHLSKERKTACQRNK